MSAAVRFVFVLHDHQPVGNFDEVIEQAYRDSYLPFLDLFDHLVEVADGLMVVEDEDEPDGGGHAILGGKGGGRRIFKAAVAGAKPFRALE